MKPNTILAKASDKLNSQGITDDQLREALNRIGASVAALLPGIEVKPDELFKEQHSWLISRCEHWMERHLHRQMQEPSGDTVQLLGELAIQVLENEPYRVGG